MISRGCAMSLAVTTVAVAILSQGSPTTGADKPVTPPAERFHEVQRGDTLFAIARTYGVSVAAIVSANRLADQDVVLHVGRRLRIPTTEVAAVVPTPAVAPAPAATPPMPRRPPPEPERKPPPEPERRRPFVR